MFTIVQKEKILSQVKKFFGSQEFPKAILMTISLLIPIVGGILLGQMTYGICIAFGAFLVSPNDIDGSIRLKIIGLSISTLLSMAVLLFSHFIQSLNIWHVPVWGIMIFCLSYISVFGFRASLISFSGLFAFVMSFSSLLTNEGPVAYTILLVGLGGVWYILLALARYLLFFKKQLEHYLSEAIELTAKLMDIRAALINPERDRTDLQENLLEVQTQLTANHEVLRELLIMNRLGFSNSSFQSTRLMVFAELVDMFELAVAHPVNYEKMDQILAKNPQLLNVFKDIIEAISRRLRNVGNPQNQASRTDDTEELTETINHLITTDEAQRKKAPDLDESSIMLANYRKYIQNQVNKISRIERVMQKKKTTAGTKRKREDSLRFLTRQDYSPRIILENLNLQSPIFRHSLRIAIVSVVGYSIGQYFNIVNAYWILLTIVVIMRPNYGLTRERSKNRIIGTLLGGIAAYFLIYYLHNNIFNAAMSILTFVIGMTMIQSNYKTAATFITMQVIFTYALLEPNVTSIIQYRVMDTAIGAALSSLAVWLLWPTREIGTIDKVLRHSIQANSSLLRELSTYYNTKTRQIEYKLLRKKAFLALSDLNTAYHRMLQEPDQHKENTNILYQIILLQYSFLTSLASIGTYINHNPTTPASEEFNNAIDLIYHNLKEAAHNLKSTDEMDNADVSQHSPMDNEKPDIRRIFTRNVDRKAGQQVLEEAHLVMQQLYWLLDISLQLPVLIQRVKFEKQSLLPSNILGPIHSGDK